MKKHQNGQTESLPSRDLFNTHFHSEVCHSSHGGGAVCGFFKGDPHSFTAPPLHLIVEPTLDSRKFTQGLTSSLRPRKPFPSFSQVQETPRLPLLAKKGLANKAVPAGRNLPSPSTPLLRPGRTPTPQTFLPHLLPRRRSLRFNPFRPPRGNGED